MRNNLVVEEEAEEEEEEEEEEVQSEALSVVLPEGAIPRCALAVVPRTISIE